MQRTQQLVQSLPWDRSEGSGMIEKLIIFGIVVIFFVGTIAMVEYYDQRATRSTKKSENEEPVYKECEDCWNLTPHCKTCGGKGYHE